jgi:hypothetical protein
VPSTRVIVATATRIVRMSAVNSSRRLSESLRVRDRLRGRSGV